MQGTQQSPGSRPKPGEAGDGEGLPAEPRAWVTLLITNTKQNPEAQRYQVSWVQSELESHRGLYWGEPQLGG